MVIRIMKAVFSSDTSRRQKPEEVNGKEYYFITKNHFKEYVANGKFVEHGEYDGHYYGTSLESIREIVESGKVGVVNLHCQVRKHALFARAIHEALRGVRIPYPRPLIFHRNNCIP